MSTRAPESSLCPFRLLLPDDVAIAQADREEHWDRGLMPEERALVERAVAKRQREFTAGRNCARTAMRTLGLSEKDLGAIGVGRHREPLFPSGVIGSITHTDDFCAAAMSRTGGAIASLGIDVDANTALDAALVPMVMQPDEMAVWQEAVPTTCHAAILAFSIKEAFFKAFFPLCQCYLEFGDARLVPTSSGTGADGIGRVTLTVPDRRLAALLDGLRIDGRYTFDALRVYSAVTLLR
ncbi:4'-phosphopantetheinyl transferase superfamily protein [Paucibacter sp. APW11]|uniref:Enterobactin synthase component D n=1 Tax=Roseateles aquae TaxID=3077235 RepID=A0ABU3PFG1_9BURK|nr:4'-phosphopantetheinyl transferase superfamily protein [Paucibacter sp. APW11]MDT9001115.1 4'-phosphopantetheinyl transferase superfamily protein [Paucibacter sp. APW11]